MHTWKETLTLYHCTKGAQSETWRREVISGCFWKLTSIKTALGDTLSMANSALARLPAGVSVSEADILVRGSVNDEIGAGMTAAKLLSKYGSDAFRVRSVCDNTACAPPHIRVEG